MILEILIVLSVVLGLGFLFQAIYKANKTEDMVLDSFKDSYIVREMELEHEEEEVLNDIAIFSLNDIVKIVDTEENSFAKNDLAYVIGFDEDDGSYLVANEYNKEWLFADQMKKHKVKQLA